MREAASLSANAALAGKVIDFVARRLPELLHLADGRTVEAVAGEVTLDPEAAGRDARARLVHPAARFITDPTVAYILMLVGVYGIIFEFTSPGASGPALVGAICLVLALYASTSCRSTIPALP